jgi:hypothetical protein
MLTLTFNGNTHNDLMAQINDFLQQSFGQALVPLTPAQTAPAPAPLPVIPVQPAPAPQMTPPPSAVPTTVPDYTHEQLGRAVAFWIDKAPDNRTKALALLSAQGVQGVTQLDTPAKRGAFAQALREQGVQV